MIKKPKKIIIIDHSIAREFFAPNILPYFMSLPIVEPDSDDDDIDL